MTLYFDLVNAILCLAQLFVCSDQDARGVVFFFRKTEEELTSVNCSLGAAILLAISFFIFRVLDVSNLYAKR